MPSPWPTLCFDAGTRPPYNDTDSHIESQWTLQMTDPNPQDTQTTAAAAQRREWVTPELACIPANTAEVGANPISPEGAFGTGS